MLLQSLRALCLAPGGSGSVWKYLEAQVRLPGVSGRIACGFRTELHFADVHKVKSSCSIPPCHDHQLTPSTAYTEYSIYRIQDLPKIVCLH